MGINREALGNRRAEIRSSFLAEPKDRPASTARGIHHYAMISSDVERTVRFWQETMGFPLVDMFENRDLEGSTHFFFDAGNGNLIAYFDLPGIERDSFREVIGGHHHLSISMTKENWLAAQTRLTAAGITYEVASGTSMYFHGPDGERLELIADPRGEMYGTAILDLALEQPVPAGQYTWVSGPSDPPRLSDGPGTYVEIDIAATTAQLWPIITDLNLSAKFSAEFRGARWAEGSTGPTVGASFIGSNVHAAIGEWDVPCFVHRCEEQRQFGWVTSNPDRPGAQWCFTITSDGVVSTLRYSLILGPGPSGLSPAIMKMPEKEPRILSRRLDEHRGNMQLVIEGIKADAESSNSN